MKRSLPITLFIMIIAAVLVTACNPTPQQHITPVDPVQAYRDSMARVADTAGLAAYQQWKVQNEIEEQQEQMNMQPAAIAAAAPVALASRSSAPARRTSRSSSSGGYSSGGSSSSNGTYAAKAPAKKGWSKTAKGAVIGGVAGGVAGAVINKKNRTVGAVVGAVGGGALGAVIGRKMDKRDGRF